MSFRKAGFTLSKGTILPELNLHYYPISYAMENNSFLFEAINHSLDMGQHFRCCFFHFHQAFFVDTCQTNSL